MQFTVKLFTQELFVIELFAATLLFFFKRKKSKNWGIRLLMSLIGVSIVCVILVWGKDRILSPQEPSGFSPHFFQTAYLLTMFSEMVIFLLYMVGIRYAYQITAIYALSIGCACYATRNIARCMFSLYRLSFAGPVPTFSVTVFHDPVSTMVFLLNYTVVYLCCYAIFFRRHERGDEEFLDRGVLGLLFLIILANMMLSAINEPRDSLEATSLYSFVLLSRIFLCVMGLTMQFFVLNWVKMRFQQSQMEHLLATQKSQYEIARQSIDMVNVNAHDLKNQISVILKAIQESGNTNVIETELDEMKRMVDTVDTSFWTGNKALDVALTEKARLCRLKDIHFSAMADGMAISFMSDVDIYTLFGNALDNAIEATEKIEDMESRMIAFSLRKERGAVLIHVENTYEDEPQFHHGLPQTSKEDKDFHGYGVRSIARIVEKYNGNFKMHLSGRLFCLDALLLSD